VDFWRNYCFFGNVVISSFSPRIVGAQALLRSYAFGKCLVFALRFWGGSLRRAVGGVRNWRYAEGEIHLRDFHKALKINDIQE
jgi:hypothetical protein